MITPDMSHSAMYLNYLTLSKTLHPITKGALYHSVIIRSFEAWDKFAQPPSSYEAWFEDRRFLNVRELELDFNLFEPDANQRLIGALCFITKWIPRVEVLRLRDRVSLAEHTYNEDDPATLNPFHLMKVLDTDGAAATTIPRMEWLAPQHIGFTNIQELDVGIPIQCPTLCMLLLHCGGPGWKLRRLTLRPLQMDTPVTLSFLMVESLRSPLLAEAHGIPHRPWPLDHLTLECRDWDDITSIICAYTLLLKWPLLRVDHLHLGQDFQLPLSTLFELDGVQAISALSMYSPTEHLATRLLASLPEFDAIPATVQELNVHYDVWKRCSVCLVPLINCLNVESRLPKLRTLRIWGDFCDHELRTLYTLAERRLIDIIVVHYEDGRWSPSHQKRWTPDRAPDDFECLICERRGGPLYT